METKFDSLSGVHREHVLNGTTFKTARLHSLICIAAIASSSAGSTQAQDANPVKLNIGSFDRSLEMHKPPSWAGGGGGGEEDPTPTPTGSIYYGWMSPGLQTAWGGDLFLGQGVTITVVDDFSSRNKYRGDLGDGQTRLRHGEWTLKQSGMVAPGATMVADDFYHGGAIGLPSGFNVINLSYGYTAELDRDLEKSIVTAATNNTAFISKSAGNDYGNAVGLSSGDYFSAALIGTLGNTGDVDQATAYDPVIFVGALDWNSLGTDDPLSSIASYSSTAGEDPNVQRQFLVVGVEAGASEFSFGTGLAGTSFAAPIVAGYAGVLSSKFTDASPDKVAGRLLQTAVTHTIQDYSKSIHGQGEANIGNAISPDFIN